MSSKDEKFIWSNVRCFLATIIFVIVVHGGSFIISAFTRFAVGLLDFVLRRSISIIWW